MNRGRTFLTGLTFGRRSDFVRDHGGMQEGETHRDFLRRMASTSGAYVPPALYEVVADLEERFALLEAGNETRDR